MNNETEQTRVIGELVKAAMDLAGIKSEGELSRLSGVPQPTVHRIITGESRDPRPANLYKLAQACNLQSHAFFPGNKEGHEEIVGDLIFSSEDPESLQRYLSHFVQVKDARSVSKSRPSVIRSPVRPKSQGYSVRNSVRKEIPDEMDYSDEPRLTADEVREQVQELNFAGNFDLWDSETPLSDDEVALPLFREVELAAGSGQTQVIENHGPKLRFAKSTLRRKGIDPSQAACAFVRGNSMDPILPDGTTVGVNTGDTDIRDGKIYAMDHGGMLRIKFLHRRPGGGIKVVSQNASEHPPEEYTAEEFAENIRIIGRVFWWSVLD